MSDGLVPTENIDRLIYVVRGHKVMLDEDLARLYGVATKALNQAVKRNAVRFPEDFAFRLTKPEVQGLNRSQSVTGPRKHRDPRNLPYAFTQEGVSAPSAVLRSRRAAEVFVYIMRAFVRQRALLANYPELLRRLEVVERALADQGGKVTGLDEKYQALLLLLREQFQEEEPEPPEEEKPRRRIGFGAPPTKGDVGPKSRARVLLRRRAKLP